MSASHAREIKILRMLTHELVVPLVDCWHEANYVCMVFEPFRQVCISVGVGAQVPHSVVLLVGSEATDVQPSQSPILTVQDLFGLSDAYSHGMPNQHVCQLLSSMAKVCELRHMPNF